LLLTSKFQLLCEVTRYYLLRVFVRRYELFTYKTTKHVSKKIQG